MSTVNQKIENQKNVKSSNLEDVNLENLAKKIVDKGISSITGRTKNPLYIYPEKDERTGKQFRGNKDVINGEIGKAWRDSKRKQLIRFARMIILYNSQKNENSLKSSIAEFKKFYKEFYAKNDFSLDSLTQKIGYTEKSQEELSYIKGMLQILNKK